MAKIEGQYPPIARKLTGFWSLDRALSGTDEKGEVALGAPMTIYELFGYKGVGKTTLATSLAGIVAEEYKKDIVYAPVEHIDRGLMGSILDSVGFTGMASILGGKDMMQKFMPLVKLGKDWTISDEELGDCFVEALRRNSYIVGVFDSLSAVSPVEEMQSSSADHNMGRRARLAGVWVRQILQSARFRENMTVPMTIFLTHKTTKMGGGASSVTNTGTPTSGGEAKKNLSKVRIGISRIKLDSMMMDSKGNFYDHTAYVIAGKVEHNNFGVEKRQFCAVVLSGKGIHQGLTAMYECKSLGIASFGANITLDGKKFGSMRDIVFKAHSGDSEFFLPFIEALKAPNKVAKVSDDDVKEDLYEGEEAE